MRLDDLAREAGVATTTVRLYQNRGILPGPRIVGRTGWYDQHHLDRLALVGRLREQGFSLAGIARLLETWQEGRELADLVGVEHQLDALLHRARPVELDAAELAARFPDGALTPDLVARAVDLGLLEPAGDGRVRVPDQRFLDTGAELVGLGVPAAALLDEWERLRATTDDVAHRFVALFEEHLLADDWRAELDGPGAAELSGILARLQEGAGRIVAAALDASLAREAARRLGQLVPESPTAADRAG
jgi:DNA-binding transcriptional MerR regulator